VEVIRFRGCLVRVFNHARYVETVFPDATKVPAVPHETEEYRATATRLGYGDDVWRLCREHEMAHTELSELLGEPHSRTLWAVAHGQKNAIEGSPGEMAAEEDLVLAYQLWRNLRRRALAS
jgi:hypothetical protein